MSDQSFRDVMARLPAGVVVVSARLGDGYRGMTASTLLSVSLEPPLVAVALEHEAATRAAVVQTRAFNVSLLTRAQEFIADRLAGRAPSVDGAWRDLPHRLGVNQIPIVEGCLAWLECRLAQVHGAGDHDICVGEVEHAGSAAGDPLVLWDRRFWTLR